MSKFWDAFNGVFKNKLHQRAHTFEKMFRYLDSLERPVCIVETGCLRKWENWSDGQSTLLFDIYAQHHPGSEVFSVDINPEAVQVARSIVSECTNVMCCDSVKYLSHFEREPDLVYLDSFDLDLEWPVAAGVHHLKEFTAIQRQLRPHTLLVIDDAVVSAGGYFTEDGKFNGYGTTIGGKARFVAEYAEATGVELYMKGYQVGWLNLARLP